MSEAFDPVLLTCRRTRRVPRCAVAASLAVLGYVPAHAQSAPGAFQGSITSYTGTVDRAVSVNSETITIGSPTARINWSPYDRQSGTTPIDFLPVGNTATFTSAQGIPDYTVLNRIVPMDPDRPIALNGTVISTLQGTSAIGGHVWFFSPGGILIGATAVFDVGGLLLTVVDPDVFSASDTGFTAIFDDPVLPASKIQVLPGARINALQQNSYVAMVAPRIEQGGAVRVNGSAAYVAAEKLTMTMDQGLFDVQIDIGTSDANGVVHTGETSGPANATSGDHHGIYLIAVPKNEALSMLLDGGRIGFDNAVHASIENGQIILSAGYSVSGLSFDPVDLGSEIAAPTSGITIAGGEFTSSVTGRATGSINASGGGGALNFANDVSLQALQSLTLVADSGETVTVGGDAKITSGENIDIRTAQGGSLSVSGSLQAVAEGSITLSNDGGSITADLLDLSAADIVSSGQIDASTIIFAANGDITTDDLHATDLLSLTAGGDLDTGNLISGGDIELNANGDVVTDNLTGDSVTVDAAGNFAIGDVDAQEGTFTAGDLASFYGVVAAQTITVTSGDINVDQGASLGVFGLTKLLTLNAVSGGAPVVIGSLSNIAAGQYQLFEEGELEADAIVFNATGQGNEVGPDILIGDFEISGTAAQGGGVSSFTLNTDGAARVDGDLGFSNVAPADTLTINASEIEVNTDSGSIALTGSSGQLSGALNLNADNIWITDSALLNQLETNPDFLGRDDALATNSGVTNADGFVRAGAITASVSETLLVQNSGTETNPAGIGVGDGGLTIVNDGQGTVTAIVFGSQTNSDGTVIDGKDFVGEVTLVGAGGFTSNSTVNGCAVGVPCIDPPDLPPEAILGPVELMTSTLDVDPVTFLDIALSGESDLLDDPVTSGSDPVPFDAVTSGNDPRPADAVSRCKKPRSGTRRCK